jgi:POT family proton-dependent oligopeptide transporter
MLNIVVVVGLVVTALTGIPVLLQMRGHPRGLYVLFFTEMWERFSYYGMRALLIFYLTEQFLFDDRFAQGQYAAYTTMIYLAPLWGGYLADRYLGTRKAVAFGALLLAAGHLAMAVEGRPATQTLDYAGHSYAFQAEGRMGARQVCLKLDGGCYGVQTSKSGGLSILGLPAKASLPPVLAKSDYRFVNIFYLALALIIMGVGYLKANISSIVGQLYYQGDPRRDPGYTLYYYGVNLGAFWAAVACGLVGQTVGWWAGFGLAGLGMLAGLVVFLLGKPLLEGKGEPPDPEALRRPVLGQIRLEAALYLSGLVGVAAVWWLVRQFALMGWSLLAAWVVVLGYLTWFMAVKCDKAGRERLILALVLISASIVFFVLFNQAGSSLNQFAERNTILPQNGFLTITPGQTQSFNAGFILIFAPAFAWLWSRLGQIRRDPDPALKFGLGLLQVGLGFLILVWGSQFHDAAFRVPVIFLALAYLMHTTGELCLSPVGMSEMSKLSPAVLVSTMLAVWFMSLSAGEFLGGLVARLTASDTVAGQVLDPASALQTYVRTFRNIGLAGMGAGVLLLVASPWLKRLSHGVNDPPVIEASEA